MAAKSAYKEEYAEQARKLCLLLGATDVNLANFFEVTDRTIRTWKRKHPEFAAAVDQGGMRADMEVANSLYQRALAGSEVACFFWLKNRRFVEWRDRLSHEHTGKDGEAIAVKNTVDVSGLSEEQLRLLANLRIDQ
ncbi:terminase [Paraburkholderia caribensis]|uniref:terminase n=1 Tax=Paraburkholderia caribensis TaxID=75105 RepID=UPI0034D21BAE